MHLATFCSLDRSFFWKAKCEEWGGVFVDVQENDEIVDKSVVKAEMMKDCDKRSELIGLILSLVYSF